MSTRLAGRHSVRHSLARAQAYGLLARAFGRPDLEFTSDVKDGRFGRGLAEALAALGYDDIAVPEVEPDGDSLEGEFVRLFNPSLGGNCPPYETEFTAAHVFMRSQQLADVAGFYRAFGLQVARGFHERPDHIAAELEFMGVLALQEARALARRERGNAAVCSRAQVRFLNEHLGRWLAPYAQRLRELGGESFYCRMASLAGDFVARDARWLGVEPETAAPPRGAAPEPAMPCPMSGGEADVRC